MSNGDAHSHVTDIFQDDSKRTVTVNVQFGGFLAGTPVVISGYIAQTNGAYVPFYQNDTAPTADPANSGMATLAVEVNLLPQQMKLEWPDDVIAVTQVAEIWPTVLKKSEPEMGSEPQSQGQGAIKAWKASGTWSPGSPSPKWGSSNATGGSSAGSQGN